MKPAKTIIFREIEGIWKDVAGDSGTLAEYLQNLGIIIDDNCEFARIIQYEKNRKIYYRAYGGKIIITIWKTNI